MKWLNIEIETLRGSEFLGAEPVERATWLSLLGWCSAQENDGIIPDCSEWGSRKWQQLCGVTKEEVDMQSELYSYDGGSLIVHFYPIAQQAAVKAKREAGKKGGRPKKTTTLEPLKTKDEKPHGSENDNHKDKDTSQDTLNERVIVKVMEGNSKSKGNDKESLVETPAIAWSSTDGWSGISDKDYLDWKEAYPACDSQRQLASMNQWLLSNPAKSKKKLWRKFITNWLERSQDRGGDIKSNPSKPQQQTFGAIEADRRESQRTSNMNLPC